MPNTIDIIENEEPNIDSLKRVDAPVIWNEFRAKAEALKVTAATLTVKSIDDIAGMKLARATRLALREIRIAVEHKRKELGEYHLRQTQAINADAKTLKDLIEPLELRLEDQEKFAEREEARLRAERQSARAAECAPLLSSPLTVDLGGMPDGEYASLLQDLKDAHAFRVDRERKAAEEAAAKTKAEAEERARVIAENARLKAEAEAREAEAKKEREAAAALLAKEREAAAQVAREAAAREAAERQAREAAEAVIAKQKADEAKRAAAEAKAARKAAAAPDRNKLITFAACVRGLEQPTMSTLEGKSAMAKIDVKLEELAQAIESMAENLE